MFFLAELPEVFIRVKVESQQLLKRFTLVVSIH